MDKQKRTRNQRQKQKQTEEDDTERKVRQHLGSISASLSGPGHPSHRRDVQAQAHLPEQRLVIEPTNLPTPGVFVVAVVVKFFDGETC